MEHLPRSRSRILIGVILIGAIGAGILSRTAGRNLPRLISKDLGDLLWSLMFFLILLLLRPRISTWLAAIVAMVFASAIEFLKLYHGEWIESVRGGAAGGFLLGRVFLWENFIAYAIGVLLGITLEATSLR